MYCQQFKQHAFNPSRRMLVRLRCKKWDCDYCAQINAYKWRMAIKNRIAEVGVDGWALMTVTARGRAHRHATTLTAIMASGDRFFKRLRRAFGNFDYVRVYEKHASGAFHMHILARISPADIAEARVWKTFGKKQKDGTIAKRRRYRGVGHIALKKAAFGVGLGYICDFSPIAVTDADDDNHAVNTVVYYITKYLTKSLQADFAKGTRRVQASQKFKVDAVRISDDSVWKLVKQVYYTDVLELGDVRDLSRKRLINIALFETLGVGALPVYDDTY